MRPYCVMLVMAAVLATELSAQSGEYWDASPASSYFRNGVGAPEARARHGTAFSDGKLVVIAGQNATGLINSGGIYDRSSDVWLYRPNLESGTGAPSPRHSPCVAVHGTKVFAFGGAGLPITNIFNNGGIYDTATDSWDVKPNLNSGVGSPGARYEGFAVWTGSRFLVFGGTSRHPASGYQIPVFNGGLYDPATDSWEVVPALTSSLPAPEFNDGAVWTGEHLIARGGFGGSVITYPGSDGFVCAAGGVFDPDSKAWLSTPTIRAGVVAPDRWQRPCVWTGEWFLEWGGRNEQVALPQVNLFNNGLAYNPLTDAFLSKPNLNSGTGAPTARIGHVGVWTGSHFFILGGQGNLGANLPFDGGLYEPIVDQWAVAPSLTGTIGAPIDRNLPSCTWTGGEVLVWGGSNIGVVYNTGGVYVPPRVAPTIRSVAPSGATPTVWPMGGVPPGGQSVVVGQFWRHRVTVYGCPRSTVTVSGMPPWMTQRYLDTGCFLEGTPTIADDNVLSTIVITATNGIGSPATQTFTVAVGNGSLSGSFTSMPVAAAIAAEPYAYTPMFAGLGGPMVVPVTRPAWMAWDGVSLTGVPPLALSGTSDMVELKLMVGSTVLAAQTFPVGVAFNPKDVTKDKAIDVVDVQRLVNLILALGVPAYQNEGDVNADSAVDVVDVQAVVNKILSP